MSYNFKNLVFEGGGVRGIAYVGVGEALDELGFLPQIERVGGTSAGALYAILTGLNFSCEEAQEILWALNFNEFKDDSWGVIRDSARMLTEFGWHKGDFFRNWVADIIARKTGNRESTFAEVEAMKEKHGFKSLYFMGTNLSTRFTEVLSAEHTPNMKIADAVRISMSIPLFFAAQRSDTGDLYVDGGVLNNYPIKLFDRRKYIDSGNFSETDYYVDENSSIDQERSPELRYVYNKETLGFRLTTREQISVFRDQCDPTHRPIDNLVEYLWVLANTIFEGQQNTHLHSDDWQRTVYVDSKGVDIINFDLSDDDKRKLIESGRSGVSEYFEWYNNCSDAANK